MTLRKKSPAKSRPIVYKKPKVETCVGKESLTATVARELLGWEEETDKAKFNTDYLCTDFNGTKIRCYNNVINRPFYASTMLGLKQEILRGKWRLNMENRIIGQTGLVLNGQHTLVALVLAAQEWLARKDIWSNWKTEPTIETTIAFGADESDESVNTMDTCKPRSLADVIFRSTIFNSLQPKERREAARMLDHTIRLLWFRLGICMDAFAPRRTHSEAIDFAERHPKLIDCVKHVMEENKDNRVGRYLSPGYMSALLYLMGCSKTDPTEYRNADNPNEELLEWSQWDKASDFIVQLAGSDDATKAVRNVLSKMQQDEEDGRDAKCGMLAKAWIAYATDKPITAKAIQLKYEGNDEEGWALAECPIVGGIDYGDPNTAEDAADLREQFEESKSPSPKEIESRAKDERKKNGDEPKPEPKAKLKPKARAKTATPKKKKDPKKLVGKRAWVDNGKEEPWQGKIVEVVGKSIKLKVLTGHQGAGNIRAARRSDLRSEQPA